MGGGLFSSDTLPGNEKVLPHSGFLHLNGIRSFFYYKTQYKICGHTETKIKSKQKAMLAMLVFPFP